MKMRAILLLVALFLMLAVAFNSFAQQQPASEQATYVLKSQALNNGGGIASGSGYQMQGTIGQANVDVLQGGSYRLTSGFWHPQDQPGQPPDDGIKSLYLPSLEK